MGAAQRSACIPYASTPNLCRVRALAAWLEASGITESTLFRRVDQHGRLGSAALNDEPWRAS
jgi:hypothetical protein